MKSFKYLPMPKVLFFIDLESWFTKEVNAKKMALISYAKATHLLTAVVHAYKRSEDGSWEKVANIKTLATPDKLARLSKLFNKHPDAWIIAHNANFDLALLKEHLPDFDKQRKHVYMDTLAMAQYLWHGSDTVGKRASLGIDNIGQTLLGVGKLDFELIQGVTLDMILTTDAGDIYGTKLLKYNQRDVSILAKLFFKLISRVPNCHLFTINWAAQQFINPKLLLNKAVVSNHLNNSLIERDLAIQNVGSDITTLRSDAKCAAFFESKGYEVPNKITEKGNTKPALAKSDEFIFMNENQPNELGELVRARLMAKSSIEITRAENFMAIPSDYYHYHVMPSGTFTHRLAGKDGGGGNPLNLSRVSPLRSAIEPLEDYHIVVFDFSGLELHIARWGAKDNTAMEILADGKDIYSDFMCSLLGTDYDEFRALVDAKDPEADAIRFVGKTSQLSLQYGVGDKTFMRAVNASGKYRMEFDEATGIVRFFRDKRHRQVAFAWRMFEKFFIKSDKEPLMRHFNSGQWQSFINFPGEPTEDGWKWPSGRVLRYPNLEHKAGNMVYYPQWPLGKTNYRKTYGAAAFQSFCQGCANEVIDSVRFDLIEHGYHVASECYDELTVLVPKVQTFKGTSFTTDIEKSMNVIKMLAEASHLKWWKTEPPPLKVDISTGINYKDAKP